LINHIAAFIDKHHQKTILVFIAIAILLLCFGIYERLTPSVRIAWTTESEIDTLGFNLFREDVSDPGKGQQINPHLILAQGSPISGTSYHFIDRDVQAGKSYFYRLMEIDNSNEIIELESIEVQVKHEGIVELGLSILLISMAIVLYLTKQKSSQVINHE
jgi:hypothetical protein